MDNGVSADCDDIVQQNQEPDCIELEQSAEVTVTELVACGPAIQTTHIAWYRSGFHCCFKSVIPEFDLTASKPIALRESTTLKYCWPRSTPSNSSAWPMYLDHHTQVKRWTFCYNNVNKLQGIFQYPDEERYMRANKKGKRLRVRMTNNPNKDAFKFEMVAHTQSRYKLKHCLSGKYFGENNQQKLILVDMEDAVLFGDVDSFVCQTDK